MIPDNPSLFRDFLRVAFVLSDLVDERVLDGRRDTSDPPAGDSERWLDMLVKEETDCVRRFCPAALPIAADLLRVETVDAMEDMLTVRECWPSLGISSQVVGNSCIDIGLGLDTLLSCGESESEVLRLMG